MWVRRLCVVTAAAVVLLLGACAPDVPYQSGEVEYARGNYAGAETIFDEYSKRRGPYRHEAMYYKGMSQMNTGKYADAVKSFDDAIRFSDDRGTRARALSAKGRALLKINNGEGAEKAFADLYSAYSDIYPQEEALGGLLAAREMNNDLAGAQQVRAELAQKFPNSSYSGGAPAQEEARRIYRVRLLRRFVTKQSALAEIEKLQQKGVETALSRDQSRGVEEFIIQVGAFSSIAHARARADSVRMLGWDVEVGAK